MTEAEWITCDSPHQMLDYLEGRASKRKLRLFSVACCRHIERFFIDPGPGRLIEVSERYADGLASKVELGEAGAAVSRLGEEAVRPGEARLDVTDALRAVWYLAHPEDPLRFERVLRAVESRANEEKYQSDLIRDIFGNPFQPVPTIGPTCPAWSDGAIRKMAQAVYDDRRFSDLLLLADALEEAGCDDAEVLSHCHKPAEHFRGCWVVDLLLGKK